MNKSISEQLAKNIWEYFLNEFEPDCSESTITNAIMPTLISLSGNAINTAVEQKKERISELEAKLAMQHEALVNILPSDWEADSLGLVAEWDLAQKALIATTPEIKTWEQRKRVEVISECVEAVKKSERLKIKDHGQQVAYNSGFDHARQAVESIKKERSGKVGN